jgi:hypothetical protein
MQFCSRLSSGFPPRIESLMACYQFFLRKPDGSTYLKSTRNCADLAAAWRIVADMANMAVGHAAGSIFVKNDRDEVVILVGIASARVLTGQKDQPAARTRIEGMTRTA